MAHVPADHVLALAQLGNPNCPNSPWEWSIGAYANEKISAGEKEYERVGEAMRVEVGGLQFVVEPHFMRNLKGKVFDYCDGKYFVRDRVNGI